MKSFRLTEAEFAALLKRNQSKPAAGKPSRARPVGKPGLFSARAASPKPDFPRSLALQLRADGLPAPILEYAFDKQLDGSGRGWAFDLAWPDRRFAVEVDGAVHRIKGRFKADMAKHQRADALGWRVLRVSPRQVESGEALTLVRGVLDQG